jgi:uncharacterized membrane protein YcaP (DUF421 family)
MESVLRAVLIYLILFIIFRISGKRTMKESTPFGLILILLISSSVADAMKDQDRSLTNGLIQAMTLIVIHIFISNVKLGSRKTEKILGDVPTLLIENGELLNERMKQTRVTKEDILQAARLGKITRLEQIKYAILETDGSICIIPKEQQNK